MARAHEHLAEVCANVSALSKVTDKATLLSVINGAVKPLVQLNIPEGFLNPVGGQAGQNVRGRKEGEGEKDGPCPSPMPPVWPMNLEMAPTCILTATSVVEDVEEILQRGDG